MATSLDSVYGKLRSRIGTLDAAFDRYLLLPTSKRRVDRYALQEGLVSALWQSWCAFCRSTLIGSASGATNASGQKVTSPYTGLSEMEIAFVAKELSQRRQVSAVRSLQGSHLEPTWGDLSKANLIVAGINSTNQQPLLRALGAALTIKDLQLCRNASAHLNKDRLAEINRAKVRYSETKLAHPSDMIFWVDPATKYYLWKTWVEEMELVAKYAIT